MPSSRWHWTAQTPPGWSLCTKESSKQTHLLFLVVFHVWTIMKWWQQPTARPDLCETGGAKPSSSVRSTNCTSHHLPLWKGETWRVGLGGKEGLPDWRVELGGGRGESFGGWGWEGGSVRVGLGEWSLEQGGWNREGGCSRVGGPPRWEGGAGRVGGWSWKGGCRLEGGRASQMGGWSWKDRGRMGGWGTFVHSLIWRTFGESAQNLTPQKYLSGHKDWHIMFNVVTTLSRTWLTFWELVLLLSSTDLLASQLTIMHSISFESSAKMSISFDSFAKMTWSSLH